MEHLNLSLLLAILGLSVQVYCGSSSDEAPPMVAFMCGKPAMHLTQEGWQNDQQTDCLDNARDILDYCKKMYPDQDIKNVVEASKKVTIDNWCKAKHTHCRHHGSHTVRPFKCLVGPFQSEALLVPDHCVFDHFHDVTACKTFQQWNETSQNKCEGRNMKQQSFAILLPCQVDMFAGVEFVCCPRDDAPEPESRDEVDGKQSEDFLDNYQLGDAQEEEEEEDIEDVPSTEEPDMQDEQTEDDTWDDEYYDDEYDEDDWSDEEDDYDDDWSDEDWDDEEEEEDAPEEVSTSTVASPAATDEAPQVTDVYTQYLRSGQENGNEHTYFSMAKSELQKHHHEKVTKMMKEWAAARQRVQEMKATDPKAADKLNREITARFQKTYQALEQEGAAEKKQLVALHQQRVQADLNEKKRHAMEHYMTALQKPTPDGQAIAKALKHYIKAEEKDRLHSINHYKHLRDTDPVEADRIRQQTLSHLAIIDQRIEQSREMLNRVPELAQNIQLQIEDFLTQFRELDTNIASLLVQTEERAEAVQPAAVLPTNEEQPDTDAPEPMETATPSPAVAAVSTDEDTAFRAPIEQQPAFKPTRYDDEVMEDERAYVEIKQAHVARHSVNSLSLSETSKYRMDNAHGVHTGSALGLAVGCIAVFIVIVVGIVVLKRKVTRRPVNHGFVEVDAASPEERHVANMQINGYENPTYKYFEMGQSKA